MTTSIQHKIEADLTFVQSVQSPVSCKKIEELVKNKREYKRELTTEKERNLYAALKIHLRILCGRSLPFRTVQVIKKCLKHQQPVPQRLLKTFLAADIERPKPSASKEEQKKGLRLLEQKLLDMSLLHESSFPYAESLHWVHGTNSSIFPLLPRTGYRMLSTGALLDLGMAPMCGELTGGGMGNDGINQAWISVETVRDLPRSWDYAENISRTFDPKTLEEAEAFFANSLNELETSQDLSRWDVILIRLLQLKQWNPEVFEKLTHQHSEQIQTILRAATKKTCHREAMVLEALNYPQEELERARQDPEVRKKLVEKFPPIFYPFRWEFESSFSGEFLKDLRPNNFTNYQFRSCRAWEKIVGAALQFRLFGAQHVQVIREANEEYEMKFLKEVEKTCGTPLDIPLFLQKFVQEKVEKRIEAERSSSAKSLLRLKALFEKKGCVIPAEERAWVTTPFPLLIGSTKAKCFFLAGTQEAHIPSATWGKEIDTVFVKEAHLLPVRTWLETHGLADQVRVHDISLLSPLFPLPLYHTSNDVIGEDTVLSSEDYTFIREQIAHLLPLLQKPYPDGSLRTYHGVVHGTRAAFFTAVLIEMNQAQGFTLKARAKHLPVTGFLHDTARESDGEDLWDRQSGQICEEYMVQELKLPTADAQLLSRSIADKEQDPAASLEQKIIHDADAVEIFRCLTDPSAFEQERLWCFRDQFPKPVLDLFLHESRALIALTERPLIKEFIQNSPDPLRCLVQIIKFAQCFPFLKANTCSAFDVLALPGDYLLTPEIEQAINDYLKMRK